MPRYGVPIVAVERAPEPLWGVDQRSHGLLELVARPAWHADAACREHPEVDWFPASGGSLAAAKAVCSACLVADECLAWALSLDEDVDGVWAGTSKRERRRLRRPDRRNRPAEHCARGHPMSGANLAIWGGRRFCRACHADHHRNRRRAA